MWSPCGPVWEREGDVTLEELINRRDYPECVEEVLYGRESDGADFDARTIRVAKSVLRGLLFTLGGLHDIGDTPGAHKVHALNDSTSQGSLGRCGVCTNIVKPWCMYQHCETLVCALSCQAFDQISVFGHLCFRGTTPSLKNQNLKL